MRLLNKNTVSTEAENSMIQLLQIECGQNTVSKIKTMFEDMVASQHTREEFKTHMVGTSIIE